MGSVKHSMGLDRGMEALELYRDVPVHDPLVGSKLSQRPFNQVLPSLLCA